MGKFLANVIIEPRASERTKAMASIRTSGSARGIWLSMLLFIGGIGGAAGCTSFPSRPPGFSMGERWRPLKLVSPNPLIGKKRFRLMPFVIAAMTVDGKKLPTRFENPADRKSFEAMLKKAEQVFEKQLRQQLASAPITLETDAAAVANAFVIEPWVMSWLSGGYAVVASDASQLQLMIWVQDPRNQVVAQIQFYTNVTADLLRASESARLEKGAEQLAEVVADFLKSRVSPSDDSNSNLDD